MTSSNILSTGQHAAARSAIKRQLHAIDQMHPAPVAGLAPATVARISNLRGALSALETLSPSYPARVASCATSRLRLDTPESRESLTEATDALVSDLLVIAEHYGAADPGAAHPAELLAELIDATYDPHAEPGVAEPSARHLGL